MGRPMCLCDCVYVVCVSASICVLWLLVYVSMMQALSCMQTPRKRLPLLEKVDMCLVCALVMGVNDSVKQLLSIFVTSKS